MTTRTFGNGHPAVMMALATAALIDICEASA
jgi:hypothetical protein